MAALLRHAEPMRLYLDLGDFVTKGLALHDGRQKYLRFPSAVARKLLPREGREPASLVLDEGETLPRPDDFDPDRYPRTRSFPRGEAFLDKVQEVPNARYAGWPAAAYGADRQLLGAHPTEDNIDALVRKAFLQCASRARDVEVVFILDVGAKADAIARYASVSPRTAKFMAWAAGQSTARPIDLRVESRVADASDCLAAALPTEVDVSGAGRVLLVDIGYSRTKLSIVSTEGCELLRPIEGLGVSNCVRRILRDGQERGLVEDELALINALEKSARTIEIAERRFDISRDLERAIRVLSEELASAAKQTVLEHYNRRGEVCRGLAILGGGASLVGEALSTRIQQLNLGLERTWVAEDPNFLLVNGARKREASKGT